MLHTKIFIDDIQLAIFIILKHKLIILLYILYLIFVSSSWLMNEYDDYDADGLYMIAPWQSSLVR